MYLMVHWSLYHLQSGFQLPKHTSTPLHVSSSGVFTTDTSTPLHEISYPSSSDSTTVTVLYPMIKAALGTIPASLRVMPKSLLGKLVVNVETLMPSCSSACATSKSVVSTGKFFMTLPPGVCRANRASVYALAGLLVVGPEDVARGACTGAAGGAWPARFAFSMRDRSGASAASSPLMTL